MFLYLRDPLFLLCVALYAVNRLVLKVLWPEGFAREHLNDVICIPFVVPMMLYVQRRAGLRRHDRAPQWYEVLVPIMVIALVFEVIMPQIPSGGRPFVADQMDVLCYVAGGLGATVVWRAWYGRRVREPC